MTEVNSDFTQHLRAATRGQHEALEALPFSRALLAKTLPLTAYQGQLQGYLPVLQTLEQLCATSSTAEITSVWRDNLRRSHYIEADLRFFGLPTVPPVSSNAHAFIDDLNRFAAQQPAALLGCLYVFEGSMLGARILLPVLRETYDLQGSSGCAYYAAGENYPPEHWKHFKHRLESVATQSDAHKSAIIHGAESGFSRVGAMLAALMPASET